MKKSMILALSLLFTMGMYSQKKKTVKKAPAAKTQSTVLAKADDITAELVKNKTQQFFYVFKNEKGAKKDTILTKVIDKAVPAECKITAFKAKETPLYCITWTEKNITETKTKNEEALSTFSEIWEPATKTQILANVQTTTKIKEIVFLDKLQNASETQERMRREGFEFTLTNEGDVVLKNKSQESRLTYNPTDKKYVNAGSGTGNSSAPAKKKR